MELGNATGFDFYLQDVSGLGHANLLKARDQLLAKAAQDTRVVAVRPNGQENTPQYDLQIDHAKAMALGVSVSDINSTLAGAWGGQYVNGVKGHPY